jgi:GAF domain-containing protein
MVRASRTRGGRATVAEDGREQAGGFAEMALRLHDEDTTEGTLDRVLEFAIRELDCSFAGVVLVHPKEQIETIAATDPIVAELDKIQVACGQGPDLQVVGDHRGVFVADTSADDRWPEWSARMAAAGARSMLGARLYTDDQVIGSLNFYDLRLGHFSEDDLDVAHVLARHAAVAFDAARDRDNLWQAIGSRHLIGMAQGILMERFAVDADEAFAVLRRYSQDGNVKLRAVAERVVTSRRLPDHP